MTSWITNASRLTVDYISGINGRPANNIEFTTPPPPNNWINAELWPRYYELTRKYPADFARIQNYIGQFRQSDIEMIIPCLGDHKCQVICNCVKPCGCGPLPSAYVLCNGDLFSAILKSRNRICNLAKSSGAIQQDDFYLELEYIRQSTQIGLIPRDSAQPEFEYKFKNTPNIPDTKYVYRYPY